MNQLLKQLGDFLHWLVTGRSLSVPVVVVAPVAQIQWLTYDPSGSKSGTIYDDVMSRCPGWMLSQIRNTDKATQCHEATHGVDHVLSQQYSQMYGCYYVGGGRYFHARDTQTTIEQVYAFVRQEDRGKVFEQYLGRRNWERSALFVWDEQASYANDAQCVRELGLRDDGGHQFATEFIAYCDAAIRAIKEHDPDYDMGQLKLFDDWQTKRIRAMETFAGEVEAVPKECAGCVA